MSLHIRHYELLFKVFLTLCTIKFSQFLAVLASVNESILHRASNMTNQARLSTISYHGWDRVDSRKGF